MNILLGNLETLIEGNPTAFATLILAIVTVVAILKEPFSKWLNRPKIVILPDPEDEGRSGVSFKIANEGRSSVNGVKAYLKVFPYGQILASVRNSSELRDIDKIPLLNERQWPIPWKLHSAGFPGLEKRLVESTYTGITIFPGQTVKLRGFERMEFGQSTVMGLNAPPFLEGEENPSWPPLFWETGKADDAVKPNLKSNEKYAFAVSLFGQELKWSIQRRFIISWVQSESDGRLNIRYPGGEWKLERKHDIRMTRKTLKSGKNYFKYARK